MLPNNNLQILKINKSDEGVYRCEGRVEARGEIDFRDIIVIVNGKKQNWMIGVLFSLCCNNNACQYFEINCNIL